MKSGHCGITLQADLYFPSSNGTATDWNGVEDRLRGPLPSPFSLRSTPTLLNIRAQQSSREASAHASASASASAPAERIQYVVTIDHAGCQSRVRENTPDGYAGKQSLTNSLSVSVCLSLSRDQGSFGLLSSCICCPTLNGKQGGQLGSAVLASTSPLTGGGDPMPPSFLQDTRIVCVRLATLEKASLTPF